MTAETVTDNSGGQPMSDPAPNADVTDDTPAVDTSNAAGAQGEASGDGGAPNEGESDTLVSDEDFERLQDDPGELKRHFQRAFTQYTQKNAPARRLWKILNENPSFVLEQLAKAQGYTLTKGEGPNDAQPSKPAEQDPETKALEMLSSSIGEDAARALLPAVRQLIESEVKPYKDEAARTRLEASKEIARQTEEAFTKQYPDWKRHETAMNNLAQFVEPRGLSPFQYMELLLKAVASEGQISAKVGETVTRMQKSAQAIAESKVSGLPEPAAPPPQPSGPLSIRDAIMASAEELRRRK